MQTIKFKQWPCVLEFGSYENGRIAIVLKGAPESEFNGEHIATATVNLPDAELEDNQLLLKNWSENEGMLQAFIEAGLVKDTGRRVPTGFVMAHVVRMTDKLRNMMIEEAKSL